jgi:hypothetical protein
MKPRKKPPIVFLTLTVFIGGLIALILRRFPKAEKSTPQPALQSRSRHISLFDRAMQAIDHAVGWDKLPTPLGLLVLIGIRNILRQKNLYDTTHEPAINLPPIEPPDPRFAKVRTLDGTYNDLENPRMGMAGSRFGRNVPIEDTVPEPEPAILTPNPRFVSTQLLQRETFQPATSLNLLAAAWIQFMIRDWFSHGKHPTENPWKIPLQEDDYWPEHPMTILRVASDPTRPADSNYLPPTYVNTETHWWDASQIYPADKRLLALVRSGQEGKLVIGPDGLLQLPTDPTLNPALVPGWWLGLEMMQTVFTREHNAICDRLRAEYPHWSDEDLFAHAHLIVAALIAKIHTVEWTPAMISHPTTQAAMLADWWGLETESLHKFFGHLTKNEIIGGIPGSDTNHFGVPYALTEEFTVVYRMHPLIPDDFNFHSVADDHLISEHPFPELAGPYAQEIVRQIEMTDLFYSFGTSHPGALVLHNYPRSLQRFERPDSLLMDLAATDILRSRELGVPRYNQFRKLLHLRPASSFEELVENPAWAKELRYIYDNDIDRVDLIVGMFAEKRPKGFAFSETAFRVFTVMAPRRLNSDRFITKDYTPEVYTQVGMDWIRDNGFSSVLLRHYPQLRSALHTVKNPFTPWIKAVSVGKNP